MYIHLSLSIYIYIYVYNVYTHRYCILHATDSQL